MTQKQVSNPDLTITLEEVKRDIAMDFNCVNIGIIEAFNPANQTATVRAALKQVIEIKPDGTKVLQEHPLVLEVPVVVLYGGSAHITFPIAPGDNCLLLFNDRELDEWLYNGGVQTPQFPRAHDFSDAIV